MPNSPKPVSLRKPWSTIQNNSDFQSIYKIGRKHFTKGLGLFVAPVKEGFPPQLGFVASAAKAGNAVNRNRAKRRMRILARSVIVKSASASYNYVLIATSETVKQNFADLKKDLQTALSRLKIQA